MATFNNSIKISVRIPYITQGCTLEYSWIDFKITSEDVWYSGNVWKASAWYGDNHLLFQGKITNTRNGEIHTSTNKIRVTNTYDGMYEGYLSFKAKVIEYN